MSTEKQEQFSVGDMVRLTEDASIFHRGDEGVVTRVEEIGWIKVTVGDDCFYTIERFGQIEKIEEAQHGEP